MKKLNSLKFVLVILISVFSVQQVSAKYWFRLQVEAKCKDSEGNIRNDIGFVAVKFSTQPTEATKRSDLAQLHTGDSWWWDGYPNKWPATVHMLAKGEDSWQFDHWELEDGTKISNSNQETGTASHNYYSTNRCPGTSSSGTHEHAAFYTEHTYYAVFRRVLSQAVFAYPQPTSLGEVKYYKENAIGDNITLRTYTLDYHNKFLGWVKQGDENNIITTDRVLSFTITDETKGTYIAKYDDGYNFVRFKNFDTGRYMDFTSDDGTLQNLTALELKPSLNDVISEAGSIIEIKEGTVKGSSGSKHTYFDYYMQNAKASKFYDFDPTDPDPTSPNGIYLRMPHDVDNNVDTWALSTDDNVQSGYRIGDQNGSPHVYMGKRDDADWWIEPMDKDLETCENYFSLDPNKLVEVDGKYYTTLRTSWNILFNPEQMTPYIVKSVDETAGTFEMEAITGNIIPAGTPVIIETNSNDIEENRMVPTTTAAASGAVPSGNLLQTSTKYFPNQSVSTSSNYKKLMVNTNGQLAFGGSALSSLNGNEAYLCVANEVVLPSKISNITLADLLASGDTEKIYNVIDLTGVNVVAHDELLICKDNNGYAKKDANTEGYVDFMHNTSGLTLTVPQTYDQSNWIGLRRPEGQEFPANVLGSPLKGVVGKLIDTINPEFQLIQLPEATTGTAASTALNPYIAASFYGLNHQKSEVNNKWYFFVQPKPMELANVEMAQWDGNKFIVPVHDEAHPTWNTAELSGEFEFNGSYLEQGGVFLEAGHIYKMCPAVVKYNDGTNHPHVYVIGTVNDLNSGDWNPNKGVEMWTRDGNIYTATLTVNDADNGAGYFSFTKKLGASWDDINAYRFGADTESMEYAGNYPVSESDLDTELPMRADWSDGTRPFKLSSGTYRLTVNLRTMKLIVSKTKVTATGRDGSRQYVVYPLALEKVTSEEGGVITGLRDLTNPEVIGTDYYNTTGMRSSRPWPGVNIVVTRYSDGSRSAVKVVK